MYLHIGLSKTGTTACQHAFDASRIALRAAGLLYPLAGIEAHHHFHVAQALLSARRISEEARRCPLASLDAERRESGLPTLVSSEHFSDATDEDIAAIRRFFGPHTTVIVSLRNQVDWCSAVYAEAIRWGFRSSFGTFLGQIEGSLDYEPLLARWTAVFGRDRIKVVSYDRHRHDIAREILAVANVADPGLVSDARVHPTLSAPFVHLQYELSEEPGVGQRLESGLRRMEDRFKRSGVSVPQNWRIPETAVASMHRLEAANDRIAEGFGLPKPLFGSALGKIIAGNQEHGHAADSIADWLLGAQQAAAPPARR